MKRLFATGFLAILVIGFLVQEWDFGRRRQVADAVVIESATYGRSGVASADVIVLGGARQYRATMRAWYSHLKPGQRVRVLYLPDEPSEVVPDWFWQRHAGSVIALILFSGLATSQVVDNLGWRRRRGIALLRDDYVAPRIGSTTTVLPIDTSPALWDRDLDG